jgi:TonB family protein
MTAMPRIAPETRADESANDRLKKAFDSWLWNSVILATVAHFAVFAFSPELTAEDLGATSSVLTTVELPPVLDIPEPPQPIARPARPVIAAVDMAEDVTIEPNRWRDYPVDALPPPPDQLTTEVPPERPFFPYDVAPRVQNVEDVLRSLKREYPNTLRQAGIGGTVSVLFYIDGEGRVQDTRIAHSSGHAALDEAALAVSAIYRFSPALNRDRAVPVWVSIPIIFEVR